MITILDYIINFPDTTIVVDKSLDKDTLDEIRYLSPNLNLVVLNTNMYESNYGFTASLEALLDQLADGITGY